MGDSSTYDHRAFAKRHDDDITVLPCALGEPVCGDAVSYTHLTLPTNREV